MACFRPRHSSSSVFRLAGCWIEDWVRTSAVGLLLLLLLGRLTPSLRAVTLGLGRKNIYLLLLLLLLLLPLAYF